MRLFLPGFWRKKVSDHWFLSRDGDEEALALFRRHYSFREYKDGRIRKLFVGPGQKTVLISAEADAIFVWRKFISRDSQNGINCSIFRNESPTLSSILILEAEQVAWRRWPSERFYTYVCPRRIRGTNPGFCFKKAGWIRCGSTKGGLFVFEKFTNK